MNETILEQILALKEMAVPELQARYSELFDGKKAPSNNKTYLWQRQLTERAKRVNVSQCAN